MKKLRKPYRFIYDPNFIELYVQGFIRKDEERGNLNQLNDFMI